MAVPYSVGVVPRLQGVEEAGRRLRELHGATADAHGGVGRSGIVGIAWLTPRLVRMSEIQGAGSSRVPSPLEMAPGVEGDAPLLPDDEGAVDRS